MSRYRLRLYVGQNATPIVEPLDADDEEDARAFAEMRLLLTRDYTHVHVYDGDRQVAEFHRSVSGNHHGEDVITLRHDH